MLCTVLLAFLLLTACPLFALRLQKQKEKDKEKEKEKEVPGKKAPDGQNLGSYYIPRYERVGANVGMTKTEVLTEFYRKHDPDKIDQVQKLVGNGTAYNFKDVVKSLKKKYGEVPKPWQSELGWF